jgi:hypothetical protein
MAAKSKINQNLPYYTLVFLILTLGVLFAISNNFSNNTITGMVTADFSTNSLDYSLELKEISTPIRSLKISGEIMGKGQSLVILRYEELNSETNNQEFNELIVMNKTSILESYFFNNECLETCDINISSDKYELLFYLNNTQIKLRDVYYQYPIN